MKSTKLNPNYVARNKTLSQSLLQTMPTSIGQKPAALVSDGAGGSRWQIRATTNLTTGALDWQANDNGMFAASYSANTTITFSNALEGMCITFAVKNTSAATITLTFPTVKTQDTLVNTVQAGKENIYTIFLMNGSYYAAVWDGVA